MGALTALGWLSAGCLALCAAPQCIKSLRTKQARDLSWAFLLLWFIGEVAGLIYLLPQLLTNYQVTPIVVNYALNCVFVGLILAVKAKE